MSETKEEVSCIGSPVNFKSQDYYQSHKITSNLENKLNCEECSFGTNYKKDLVQHFMSTHSLQCQVCSHVSTKMFEYKKHKLSHITAKSIKCNLCDYSCKIKTQLDFHMIRIHENKKAFVCDSCGKRFNTKGSLSRHAKRIHLKTLPPRNASNRPMTCEICQHILASKDVYRRHILLQHSNLTKKYKCKMCKYEAKEFGSLRDHTIGSHGKKIKCLYCSFSAPRHSRVVTHTDEKHPEKPPFVCQDCGFCGRDITIIGEHIKASHTSPSDTDILKYLDMLDELRRTHDRRLYEMRRAMGREKSKTDNGKIPKEVIDVENNLKPEPELVQPKVETESLCFSNEKKEEKEVCFDEDVSCNILPDNGGPFLQVKLKIEDSVDEKDSLIIKGLPEEKLEDVKRIVENCKKLNKELLNSEGEMFQLDYRCSSCEFVAFSEDELLDHQELSHDFFFQCQQCSFSTPSHIKLTNHVEKKHRLSYGKKVNSNIILKFSCKICKEFSATDKIEVEKHMNNVHNEGEEMFICHMCGTAKKDATGLKLHMLTHSSEKPFKCQLCDFAGKQKRFLDIHIVRVHENKKDYVCEMCGKGYNDKLGLTRHLKGVHLKAPPLRNFEATKCEACGKVLVSKDSYKRHMLLQHSNAKKLKCGMCKYEAKEVGTLKDHVVGSHGKRLHCLYCPFSAPRHSRILSHTISKHLDKPAFKCEVCSFTSQDIYSVNQHMISYHEIERSDIGQYLRLINAVMEQHDGRLWEKRRVMGKKVENC